MSDKRARAILPVAAALVDAVAKRDEAAVESLLDGVDWQALCVVLAEQAGRGPAERYTACVLADLAAGERHDVIARRYGITVAAVRALAGDNRPNQSPNYTIPESAAVLAGGRWVRTGLIQTWIPNEREVA